MTRRGATILFVACLVIWTPAGVLGMDIWDTRNRAEFMRESLQRYDPDGCIIPGDLTGACAPLKSADGFSLSEYAFVLLPRFEALLRSTPSLREDARAAELKGYALAGLVWFVLPMAILTATYAWLLKRVVVSTTRRRVSDPL